VVEEEQKEVTTKDSVTGEEKVDIVKVPVTKNKVVPKGTAPSLPTAAPLATPVDIPEVAPAVAQNSTHQVVPVTEIEEKEEVKTDPVT
jgi:hypothetical protein